MKYAMLVVLSLLYAKPAYAQTSAPTLAEMEDKPVALVGEYLSFGVAHMTQPGEFSATGPSFGLGVAAQIATFDEVPVYFEWNGAWARATDDTTATRQLGANPFVLTAGTGPIGTIGLATAVEATGVSSDATVAVTDSAGDTALIISSAFSPIAPDTAVSQFALSQTQSGGAYAALTTNGDAGSAAAYGAIFDDTGFLFVSAGDQSGTSIRSTTTNTVTLVTHSFFVSTSHALDDQWTLSPKIGPIYRRFDRATQNSTIIDIDEGFDLAPLVPDIALSETISLDSSYIGAIFGASLSRQIRDDWQVNFGAEVGLARFQARGDSFETVRIATANTRIPGQRLSRDGTTAIGRLTAGVTHVRPSGAIINLNVFVDYMSNVPFVSTETIFDPVTQVNGAQVNDEACRETYRSHTIKQAEMINQASASVWCFCSSKTTPAPVLFQSRVADDFVVARPHGQSRMIAIPAQRVQHDRANDLSFGWGDLK